MRRVKLNKAEIGWASIIGVRRQVEAMLKGLEHVNQMDEKDGWGNHIDGACGELAFCLAYGFRWDGSVNTFRCKGDVGKLEIRAARYHKKKGPPSLIVRPFDKDEAPYVLVWLHHPDVFEIVGWAYGWEAKQPEWLRNHGNRGPAHFMPWSLCHSMESCPMPEPSHFYEETRECSLAS